MEKGGLAAALRRAGLTQESNLVWADEMRLGLHGQIRRVWAPRGVKVRQRVQMERLWCYLALAANPHTGRLSWRWMANMRGATIAEAVRYWREQGIDAVVWDGARGHSSPEVCKVGMVLIPQPPYAPELDPVERIFEELRRAAEGQVYGSLDEKIAIVEQELRKLAADPERVKRLTNWHWIRDAYAQLPQKMAYS